MKTLYLIRHAKSSWDHPGLKDFERPLLETGIKKTKKIIRFLNDKKITAGLIISSPAVRALETAKLIAKGTGYQVEDIQIEPSIYDAAIDDYLEVISSVPDEIGSLMIFGHNPAISYVANLFLRNKIEYMPTTGVVSLSFDSEHWTSITDTKPSKEALIFPNMLK